MVGPFVLLRERRIGGQEWYARLQEVAEGSRRSTERLTHITTLATGALLALAGNASLRHWLMEMAANVAVVGGFVAAPVLTVTAWIGLVLPESVPLHHVSTTLFVVALVWVCTAVLIAHVHERGGEYSAD